MKNKIFAFFLLSLMSFILSSCSIIESPKSLMKRPSSYNYNSDIQGILSNFLTNKKNLTLAYGDKDGKSIKEVDLDGDKEKELVVLFKNTSLTYSYGVMILKKSENAWYKINSIPINAMNIEFVKCEDLTQDGLPELLIGYTLGSQNKIMDIYSSHNGFFENIENLPYNYIDICDLNDDGKNELVLLNNEKNIKISLSVYGYSNKLKLITNTSLNSPVTKSYMIAGRFSNHKKAIYINLINDNKVSYTNLFILKGNKLISLLNKNSLLIPSLENNYFHPSDINNDNILEIPILESKFNSYTNSNSNIISWYAWDGEKSLDLSLEQYLNYEYKYSIDIPNEFKNSIFINENISEDNVKNRCDFYTLSEDHEQINSFYIYIFTEKQWEYKKKALSKNSYTVLHINENKDVTIGLIAPKNSNSKLIISLEKLKSIFNIISESP